jgi:hypothetical protein
MKETLGNLLAVSGAILSLSGALINNIMLDHAGAMWVWMISNPIFLSYFIGADYGWWNGEHISTRALIITYAVFTVSNFWGLMYAQ